MPGKRPRMRRTSSVCLIETGSMTGDCSPLPEHPKEKQKPSSINSHCSATTTIRQVIGFHPKVIIEEENHLVLPPTSPRPQQAKSPTGSTGSPRSGLGDLLAGSRRWERRDEGVGLGIVAALGAVSQEDCSANGVNKGRAEFSPVPTYTRKTSPQHLPPVFVPAKTTPPIPIHSPGSNSPSSHHCPSSHRYTQDCAPQFGLSSAMQESMMQDISNSHRVGPSGRVNHGDAVSLLTAWSQQAENMEVEAMLSVAPSPVVPKSSYIPMLPAGLNFLDACFYCKRRLGEGRDIYMYRGDKAFCSPECRQQQIAIDERPEKCSQAVMKIGGADASRHSSQRNRVVAAGTAAAA